MIQNGRQKITAPSSHLDKKYHVQIDCVADSDLLARITKERLVDDDSRKTDAGEDLRAKTASLLRHGDKNSWLEITLDEGKNRQIRRLLEALGVRVLRLVRVSIGPLRTWQPAKGRSAAVDSARKRRARRRLGCPVEMQITASARVNVLEKQGAFPLLGRYAVGFQIVLCLAQYLAFIAVCQLTRRIGDAGPRQRA